MRKWLTGISTQPNTAEIGWVPSLISSKFFQENDEKSIKNIELQNIIINKIEKLDKDKPICVYCKKGGRSAKAAKRLKEIGFKKIYDLEGGITNWEDTNKKGK